MAAKTKIFTRATSLGGVESLIEHRASIEGPGTHSPEGLLRFSIGLEHPDDLIEDLDQALRNERRSPNRVLSWDAFASLELTSPDGAADHLAR